MKKRLLSLIAAGAMFGAVVAPSAAGAHSTGMNVQSNFGPCIFRISGFDYYGNPAGSTRDTNSACSNIKVYLHWYNGGGQYLDYTTAYTLNDYIRYVGSVHPTGSDDHWCDVQSTHKVTSAQVEWAWLHDSNAFCD